MQSFKRKGRNPAEDAGAEMGGISPQAMEGPTEVGEPSTTTSSGLPAPAPAHTHTRSKETHSPGLPVSEPDIADERTAPRVVLDDRVLDVSWQMCVIIIAGFS
jgi:hypothetical protein